MRTVGLGGALFILASCSPGEGIPSGSDPGSLTFDLPGKQQVSAQTPQVSQVVSSKVMRPAMPVAPGFHWDQLRGYDKQLQSEIEAAVNQGLVDAKTHGKLARGDCSVAVFALDLMQRKQILALGSKRAQRPASNQKILTVVAALGAWGVAGQFVTPVEIQGEVRAGTLTGSLILRAGGDPVYDRAAESAMPAWAQDIAQMLKGEGVERIQGDLVLDTGTYPTPGPAPAWPSQGERWQEYCALAGGFSANAGCLSAVLQSLPGMLRVRVVPPGHGLTEQITVRKGPAGKALDVRVGVQGSKVIVGGTIPAGLPQWSTRFAHPNPLDLFGGSLVFALGLHGVELDGVVRIQTNAPRGKAIGEVRRPLQGQLGAILLDSNNSVADQVFLTLGAREGDGSRAGAALAVRKQLAALGLDTGNLVMLDGSGLSRDNSTNTRTLAAAMAALWERHPPAFAVFLSALPVAGKSGSLTQRMRSGLAKGTVAAKTGFIGGTSGLTGLVMEDDRARLAFSILVEYPRKGGLNTRAWKPMQDSIAQSLAGWVRSHPTNATPR